MDEVEILAFRAGTKASKGLTSAHIAEAATNYNADKDPAPLVFGHPTSDSPALGLISKARAAGNDLFLTLKNIKDDAVTAVREGRVLGRSIAFWDPHHPSNPNPGKFSIRHLGLLGGQAPAIPGMGRLKFSADDSVLEADEDPADAVVFAADPSPTPVQVITEPKPKEPVMEFTAEQIADFRAKAERADTAEAELARIKADNEKREREFAAAEQTRRENENAATLTAAVEAGKVLPAEKDDLAAIFNALPTQAMTFSAGEVEPRTALASFIDKLPKRGPAKGEKPISERGQTFSADDNAKRAEEALAAANQATTSAWKPQATQH